MEDTDAGTEGRALAEHRGRPRRSNAVIEVRFLVAQLCQVLIESTIPFFPNNLADFAQPLADSAS